MSAALDLLKQKKKRLEQEQKKTLAGLEKRKEELETKISVFDGGVPSERGESAAGERADEAGDLPEGRTDRAGAEDEKRISEEPEMGCCVCGDCRFSACSSVFCSSSI